MSVRAVLDELDVAAVLIAFRDQEARFGHTAEADDDLALAYFRNELITRAQELDVILPGDRQRLDIGYERAARLGAMAIATMRRIRREQAACNTAARSAPPQCSHPIEARARRNTDFAIVCQACGQELDR